MQIFYILVLLSLNNVQSDTSSCGRIFDKRQFLLTSENYPLPYPNDFRCFYLLKSENCSNSRYKIQFLDFDLDGSAGCVKDRLEIGVQDALCGSQTGFKVYPAENGSLILKFVSGNEARERRRGFKLLVDRFDDCEDSSTNFEVEDFATTTMEPPQFEWTTTPRQVATYLPPVLENCCSQNVFSKSSFHLISPGFPYSLKEPENCIYTIRKSNYLVCRLRIKLHYFLLGHEQNGKQCSGGYLEIDGKFICGCQENMEFTTNFGMENVKVLRFVSAGNQWDMSGFALEIVQDECEKTQFRFYRDQSNTIKFPKQFEQLKLLREQTFYSPSAQTHNYVYFFGPDDEDEDSWISQIDKEESDFAGYSLNKKCVNWNQNQLNFVFKTYLEKCENLLKQSENDCLVLESISGQFSSINFPYGYPANSEICYRFQLSPGFCAVQLFFQDFQVERSYNCLKDYLQIGRNRYCGSYLARKQVTITPSHNFNFQELRFKTDDKFCEKGFSASYRQIQCENPDEKSILPFSKCSPEKRTFQECKYVIADREFAIRNSGRNNLCQYDIERNNKNVCKLALYFQQFNLPCSSGSFSINEESFCGNKTGTSVMLNFEDDKIKLKYSQNQNPDFLISFRIEGRQIETDCDNSIPDPV